MQVQRCWVTLAYGMNSIDTGLLEISHEFLVKPFSIDELLKDWRILELHLVWVLLPATLEIYLPFLCNDLCLATNDGL